MCLFPTAPSGSPGSCAAWPSDLPTCSSSPAISSQVEPPAVISFHRLFLSGVSGFLKRGFLAVRSSAHQRDDKLVVVYLPHCGVQGNLTAAEILCHTVKIDGLAPIAARSGQKNHGCGPCVHPHRLILLGNVVEAVDARPRNRAPKNSIVVFFDDKSSPPERRKFLKFRSRHSHQHS